MAAEKRLKVNIVQASRLQEVDSCDLPAAITSFVNRETLALRSALAGAYFAYVGGYVLTPTQTAQSCSRCCLYDRSQEALAPEVFRHGLCFRPVRAAAFPSCSTVLQGNIYSQSL